MNGFDNILIFFDRIYQPSLKLRLGRQDLLDFLFFISGHRPVGPTPRRDEIKNTPSPAARQVRTRIKQSHFLNRN